MSVAAGPYLQLALEQSPGYEGSNVKVSSVVTYPPLEEVTDDEAMTALEEQNVIRGFLARMPHLGAAMYEPKFKLGKIHPRPSHLGFLLALMLGDVTSVVGDGTTYTDPDGFEVPTGAYMHTMKFRFAVEPATCQALASTGNLEHRQATGIALSDLKFSFANGAMLADGDGLALTTVPIADPGVTPIIDLAMPFRRGDMVLDWLSGSALTRDFEFAFNAPVEQIWSPIHASLFPTDIWYKNGEMPYVSGTISKATIADDDWAALAEGGQFAASIRIGHRDPLGTKVVAVTSVATGTGNSLVTCSGPHGCKSGDIGTLAGVTGSVAPSTVNGEQVITVTGPDTFTIPLTVTHAGTGGTFTSDYHAAFWTVMPGCELTKLTRDAIKAERRREGKYEWESRYDHTTGELATITIVNDVPTYATYS